jgi:predicted RNA-binding Zn ribbon-like protein
VARYDLPKAAPEPLRRVQLFVNTVDFEHEREWLATPAALADWFEENGFELGDPVTDADLRRAIELREALRALLRANNGRALPEGAVAGVNHAAHAAGLAAELDGRGNVVLEQSASGVDGALGRILAIAFASLLDGSWSRLKACRNCGWIFHDYSRNRSAGWCSMAICGNRLKTKAYRKRKSGRSVDL